MLERYDLETPRHGANLERLLHELRNADTDLLTCLEMQAELAGRPNPDVLKITRTRWLLSRARRNRRLLVQQASERLEPILVGKEREDLLDLRVQHRRVLQISSELVGKWNSRAVSTDWVEYRRESSAVRSGWIALIHAEARLLYPLLARYAGLPAHFYPPPTGGSRPAWSYAAAADDHRLASSGTPC